MSAANWTIYAPPLPPPPDVELANPVVISTIKSHPHLFKIVTLINMDHFEDLLSAHPNQPLVQSVMKQPLSPLSYLFDLINYASLILLNKLSILFHPIIVWPCGQYYKVQGWAHV